MKRSILSVCALITGLMAFSACSNAPTTPDTTTTAAAPSTAPPGLGGTAGVNGAINAPSGQY